MVGKGRGAAQRVILRWLLGRLNALDLEKVRAVVKGMMRL
jgi:hypothetical protein